MYCRIETTMAIRIVHVYKPHDRTCQMFRFLYDFVCHSVYHIVYKCVGVCIFEVPNMHWDWDSIP